MIVLGVKLQPLSNALVAKNKIALVSIWCFSNDGKKDVFFFIVMRALRSSDHSIFMDLYLTTQLPKALQHLIRSRDCLAIDFVGALRLNHVDQFLDDIHIGRFNIALL